MLGITEFTLKMSESLFLTAVNKLSPSIVYEFFGWVPATVLSPLIDPNLRARYCSSLLFLIEILCFCLDATRET